MQLRMRIKRKNLAIKTYGLMMAMLLVARYLFRVNVPNAAFLLVSVIPAFFGSNSELLACSVSFIPLSAAFQYKYALLILMVVMLLKNRWRLKSGSVLLLVLLMMVWELLHIVYGHFSVVEYVRDFAELLFMGVLIMINIDDLDHKKIVRFMSIFTVGICTIMFIMQLQQYNFNVIDLFSRSAAEWRFGQGNMDADRFALNFDANILGFICNLSTCGLFLLRKRKEHIKTDMILMLASLFFALITLSRASIACMFMIIALYVFGGESKGLKRITSILSILAIVAIVGVAVYIYIPEIYENLMDRFNRKDIWNGRGNLFTQYMEFTFSSPIHLLFGTGMQGIIEKVSNVIWVNQVPHNGLQEALVVWGLPGPIVVLVWLGMIIRYSKVYSGPKRDFYQFVPLLLTFVFTMSVQILTESRTLLALSFSYICLCMSANAANGMKKEYRNCINNAINKFGNSPE